MNTDELSEAMARFEEGAPVAAIERTHSAAAHALRSLLDAPDETLTTMSLAVRALLLRRHREARHKDPHATYQPEIDQ